LGGFQSVMMGYLWEVDACVGNHWFPLVTGASRWFLKLSGELWE
jgi:hypothetical protein